jgi:hypothetical protein
MFDKSNMQIDIALNMAIEALQEVQKHEETFEWCHDCKEYDKDNSSCPRWSKVIRNTVEELKTDRPHGEWKIDEYGIYHCPYCHAINNTVYKSFCPNCGAKMGGDTK